MSSIGKRPSFFLAPFNYHDSDPSMASRDAIRISYDTSSGSGESIKVDNYGLPKDFSCHSEHKEEQELSNFNMSLMFEQT